MLQVLNMWNRWGSAKLSSGHRRDIVEQIKKFIPFPEVISLIGLRRAGKTTVLYQIMDILEEQGIPPQAILHMNFEEPSIAPQLSLALLDEIYQTYRNHIYPTGKAYIFFDEIQNVPQWEKWVRARNESENIKIFITGSSANLMSRELSTLLTGRHVEFYISPLSFAEILRFKNISLPTQLFNIAPSAPVQHVLNQYMVWGGFPEIVLCDDEDRKRILLQQYFSDILFKDIAMRHQVRDTVILRNIAVHLLTQTSCLFSINRIAKIFGISLEMASNYCNFIQESFLVDYLSYFSLKTAERNRHPHKIHVADLGLRHIASVTTSPDYGKLVETLVFQYLQRQYRGDIFYWKAQQEIDFVLRKGNSIITLIQVAYGNLDDPKTFEREISAIKIAQEQFGAIPYYLVTANMPQHNKEPWIIPLWRLLLEPNLFIT